jgi:hypothetical protein
MICGGCHSFEIINNICKCSSKNCLIKNIINNKDLKTAIKNYNEYFDIIEKENKKEIDLDWEE